MTPDEDLVPGDWVIRRSNGEEVRGHGLPTAPIRNRDVLRILYTLTIPNPDTKEVNS